MASLIILTADETSILGSLIEVIETRLYDYLDAGTLTTDDVDAMNSITDGIIRGDNLTLSPAEVATARKILAGENWAEVFRWESGDTTMDADTALSGDTARLALGSLCLKMILAS
jgi:hypothetical protein